MDKNIFGKGWYHPYQLLYRGFLIVFATAMLFFVVSWILGNDIAISWNTIAKGETIPVTMDYVNVGPFQLPIAMDNFLLTEYFDGSVLQTSPVYGYVFLGVITLVFSLILALVTTFRQFWYLIGMVLTIVFLMSLKLEALRLFGFTNQIGLVVAFIIYLPISYYFHSFKSSIPLLNRFYVFLGFSGVFGLIILFFAEVEMPFFHLISFSYFAPIILSLIFILLVANEIIAGFVYVTTRDSILKNKKNLTHFLVITAIYLINLGLVFFDKFLYLNLGIDFIHPYILLIVSSIIGFSFYQFKEKAYGNIFKYYPTGALLYISLAAMCFFTIGYYTLTANDPLLEVFKKFILYGHLGYGLLFLVYILANYITPFIQGMPVYKVLYAPQYMPYFTFRFAGTIATLALFFVTNYEVPLFQVISGYNNSLGDLYATNNKIEVAEVYYRKAGIYGYNNHHSNYAMGSIARNDRDYSKALEHYFKACQLSPSEQAYVNMSNIYKDVEQPFQALFTLQDGLKKFPNSTYLKNNLGLLYEQVGEKDSAFIFFHEVNEVDKKVSSNAGLNLLNLVAKGHYSYDIDSLIATYGSRNHLSSLNNIAVLYNIANKHDSIGNIDVADSILNLVTGYTLYNYSLNSLYQSDSIDVNYILGFANHEKNKYFSQGLKYAAALCSYKNGNNYDAFNQLEILASNSNSQKGKIFDLLGILALKEESPRLAIEYFEIAGNHGFDDAQLHLGIAYMEQGWFDEAIEIWSDLQLSADPSQRLIAEKAIHLYTIDPFNEELEDNDRYLAWRYQVARFDELKNAMVLSLFTKPEYKVKMQLDICNYYMEQGNYEKSREYLIKLMLSSHSSSITKRTGQLQLILNDVEQNKDALGKAKDLFTGYDKEYFTARLAQWNNDTTMANEIYNLYTSKSVFSEPLVIQAAKYFDQKDAFKAYIILQKALEVNKYSVALLKEYILQCAKLELERFAEHSLEELRELVPGQEMQIFENEYQHALDVARKESGYFED